MLELQDVNHSRFGILLWRNKTGTFQTDVSAVYLEEEEWSIHWKESPAYSDSVMLVGCFATSGAGNLQHVEMPNGSNEVSGNHRNKYQAFCKEAETWMSVDLPTGTRCQANLKVYQGLGRSPGSSLDMNPTDGIWRRWLQQANSRISMNCRPLPIRNRLRFLRNLGHFQWNLEKPLVILVVLSYLNYSCLICFLQTAENLQFCHTE